MRLFESPPAPNRSDPASFEAAGSGSSPRRPLLRLVLGLPLRLEGLFARFWFALLAGRLTLTAMTVRLGLLAGIGS
jgi:hypothetical protein